MSKSNSKRFVRAAWSLLFFQFIASVGAVGVTGWAVFHVQNLVTVQASSTPATTLGAAAVAPAVGASLATATQDTTEPAQAANTALPAPANTATPGPATTTTVLTAPKIAACQRIERFWRVLAQAEWCDTGVEVREGQTIYVRFGGGQSSNAGQPSFRQDGRRLQGARVEGAPLGVLIGRVGDSVFPIGSRQSIVSPNNGHLLLGMNDVRGTYADNQGWLDVYVAPQ